VETDVAAFERAVAEGTPAALERAVGLYRGDLLAGLGVTAPPFEDWLMTERERLRELALEALARLLTGQRAAGETAPAVQSARRLLALDPLQEAVHRTLMRLYAQAGRRDAALRQYQDCVDALRRELDAEPEAETKALYQEILRQRPARAATAPPTVDPPETATPLIGRERELAKIETWLGEAWAGAGGVVAIVGEAGIGKTRLLTEVTAAAARRGGSVLLANAHESEQVLPFGPWVTALRQDTALADPGSLSGLGAPWLAELARLFPELRDASLPVSPDPTDPLGLFDALTRLVRHIAGRQPALVALEDLHWADDMSLRFLGFLGRRLQGAPLLVVLTAREEELGDRSMLTRVLDELEAARRLRRLAVPPLPPEATTALVRHLSRAGARREEIARLAQQVQEASQGSELGRFPEARTVAAEGLAIARRLDEPVALSFAWAETGVLALQQGRLGEAIEALERALEARREATPPWLPRFAGALGLAYAVSGDPARGLGLLQRALEETVTARVLGRRSLLHAWLSEARLLVGLASEALEEAEQAVALATRLGERGHLAWGLRARAEAEACTGADDPERSARSYREAAALATELGMRPLVAHCHLGLGTLYCPTAERGKAEEHLTSARAMYREMGMNFWLEKPP
jgi:tetratricopeptide (TPR) repeat protein